MLYLDVPFRIDSRGRTARTDQAGQVRNMLELLLFTSPGERVNRPEFGGGVLPLVFSPNSTELAAALKFNLQSNLQRWLGDVLDVRELQVTAQDNILTVDIRYVLRQTGQEQNAQFQRTV
jgi:phage baseplate assembly protein W